MEKQFRTKLRFIKGLILILLPTSLFGCAATSPAAIDLANYVNQGVLRISELEQKSLERYASVTGANYKSDSEVYGALKDWIIPLYTRFVDGLRKIRPETDEVRKPSLDLYSWIHFTARRLQNAADSHRD